MPEIIFSNFIGQAQPAIGANTVLNVGPKGSYVSALSVDPVGRPGIVRPGFGGTDLTNVDVVTNLIRRFQLVDATATKIYGLEDRSGGGDSHIQEITLSSHTITTPVFHTIAPGSDKHDGHSTFVGSDMVSFQISGTDYFLYSWNDNTDGDIGRFTVAGGTPDDDYMTNVVEANALSKNFEHPMVVGENGILYIADGPTIHKFEDIGANGTFTASAITIPNQFVIQDMINWRGFMFILAHRRLSTADIVENHKRDVKVFIWNYISIQAGNDTGFDSVIPIDDDTFGAKRTVWRGIPYLFTVGGGFFASSSSYRKVDLFAIDCDQSYDF